MDAHKHSNLGMVSWRWGYLHKYPKGRRLATQIPPVKDLSTEATGRAQAWAEGTWCRRRPWAAPLFGARGDECWWWGWMTETLFPPDWSMFFSVCLLRFRPWALSSHLVQFNFLMHEELLILHYDFRENLELVFLFTDFHVSPWLQIFTFPVLEFIVEFPLNQSLLYHP